MVRAFVFILPDGGSNRLRRRDVRFGRAHEVRRAATEKVKSAAPRLCSRLGIRWIDTRADRALADGSRLRRGRGRSGELRRSADGRGGAGLGDRQCVDPARRAAVHRVAALGVCCAHPGPIGALPARSRWICRSGAPARRKESAAQTVHPQGAAVRGARVARVHRVTERSGRGVQHRFVAKLEESTALRYALAAVCVAIAVVLHISVIGSFLHPTGLFLAGVVAAAWFGGTGPGFLAALLATLALPSLIPMSYPLIADFFDLPRFLTFGMTGLAVGWGTVSRRRAEAALRQSENELHADRDELATQVGQRTAALRSSEERYEHAMLASQAGFWDWHVATDEFYVSPKLVEMGGFAPGSTYA